MSTANPRVLNLNFNHEIYSLSHFNNFLIEITVKGFRNQGQSSFTSGIIVLVGISFKIIIFLTLTFYVATTSSCRRII